MSHHIQPFTFKKNPIIQLLWYSTVLSFMYSFCTYSLNLLLGVGFDAVNLGLFVILSSAGLRDKHYNI